MDPLLLERVKQLKENYDILKTQNRWSSTLELDFASLIYTIKNKPYIKEEFEKLKQYIKSNTTMFSYYRSYHLFIITTLLITEFPNGQEAFSNLLYIEDFMKQVGFKKNNYSSIAAFSILSSSKTDNWQDRVYKSFNIYENMKKNHFWLTNTSDYPAAALLSNLDENSDDLTAEVEEYYSQLVEAGFSRSDGLQFLTHLLALSSKTKEDKIQTCIKLKDYFKSRGIKIYSNCYEMFGFLCLFNEYAEEAGEKVCDVYYILKDTKHFKWCTKEINLMIAVALIGEDYIDKLKNGEIVSTTFSTSIELLIAAQSAAIAGTVAASAAASSSSST